MATSKKIAVAKTTTTQKKQAISTQDKLLLGGGVVLAIAGGAVWYFRNKKAKQADTATSYNNDITVLENPTQAVVNSPKIKTPSYATPKISASNQYAIETTPNVPTVKKATFMYALGQRVMANIQSGVQTQDVQKKADGTYFTNGNNIRKFTNGEEIGKIIWRMHRADGSVKYVVKQENSFMGNTLYWVDHKNVKGFGTKIPVKNLATTTDIDSNKLLKKGVKGKEVAELQKRLKINIDGDFGKNTETALLHQKKISQIRLKDWR